MEAAINQPPCKQCLWSLCTVYCVNREKRLMSNWPAYHVQGSFLRPRTYLRLRWCVTGSIVVYNSLKKSGRIISRAHFYYHTLRIHRLLHTFIYKFKQVLRKAPKINLAFLMRCELQKYHLSVHELSCSSCSIMAATRHHFCIRQSTQIPKQRAFTKGEIMDLDLAIRAFEFWLHYVMLYCGGLDWASFF